MGVGREGLEREVVVAEVAEWRRIELVVFGHIP